MVETGWTQPRSELDRRLDGALTHRLTTVIAATGYGKSTVLKAWARAVRGAFYRIGPADRDLTSFASGVIAALRLQSVPVPGEITAAVDAPLGPDAVVDESARAGALAGAAVEGIGEEFARSAILVLDGLNEIADAPGPLRFVETLVRTAPPHLHVVIASSTDLPFPIARLRHDHDVLELDASDLALTVGETATWLEDQLGPSAVSMTPSLHVATGGWPAATRAVIDAMAKAKPVEWPRLAADVSRSSGTLEELTRQVFDDLPGHTRQLLRAATVAPVMTADLAEDLGIPPDTVPTIVSRGMFLEAGKRGYTLTPTSSRILRAYAPLDERTQHEVATIAARWYLDNDLPEFAIRSALAADHDVLVQNLLDTYGERLVEYPSDLLDALDRIEQRHSGELDHEHLRLAGLAHFNRGDWDTAHSILAKAMDTEDADALVAYRLGLIHHLRGDLGDALDVYLRGAAASPSIADAIICTAMAASVQWLRGEHAKSAALAGRARDHAASLGDHRAMAAAHTALGMLAANDGDSRASDAHFLKALMHATSAGDIAQQIRIRCNLASHRHEEGSYDAALAELESAISLCDLTGFAPWSALARSNRAEVLTRIGQIEGAAVEAAEAVQRWEAMGSRLVAYGLNHQAQIHALRGHTQAAVDTFRRAIALAEQAGDTQALGTAVTALAELRVFDDPDEAAALAARAVESRAGTSIVSAYLAGARAAMARDRVKDAHELLDRAEAEAQRRDERPGLAHVTELRAAFNDDATLADAAVAQWSAIGDPIGLSRAELLRARLGDVTTGAQVAAQVRTRLLALGCRAFDNEIDQLIARGEPAAEPQIAIQTLGTFRVVRGGTPIPTAAWQSRKARDLLKVLVTRRGRPVPRDQLIEILWPDATADDELAVAKRLNVMVSTLRAVLDPDHTRSPDYFIAPVDGSLRLDIDHVQVDVIDFLDRVNDATRLDRNHQPAEALEQWRIAEAAYTGDFCEEDGYADWATTVREEARLAYAQAAARVAIGEAEAGNHISAARYWLRLLERDPYDERAHLALVRTLDRAGHRGDARRRYQAYADLMRELDIEPSPHPT